MLEQKSSAGRKIIGFMCLMVLFLCIMFGWQYCSVEKNMEESQLQNSREKIVDLNEATQLLVQGDTEGARQCMENLEERLERENNEILKEKTTQLLMNFSMAISVVLISFLYLYLVILKPFQKLENYADELAKGNLDVSLNYEKINVFGAFTWAFDHMRSEIKKARQCEKEAIENNKVVIATLSHDIKTPIASMRAYAEALSIHMDHSPERKERYLSVIMKKCDEVTALTNDLFLHSLSDLEKLQINVGVVDANKAFKDIFDELQVEEKDIQIQGYIEEGEIIADEKRLEQAVENIVTNARKYAGTPGITIWTKREDYYELHIKDRGEGILPEDISFVFEKFYRGKNSEKAPGAGLGLFIVRYIMNQMDGEVELVNHEDGLEVVLKFSFSA